MLSYLSSWLLSDSDDPLDVVCTDFVLIKDSEDEDDSEWVWVAVSPRDKDNIETVLDEYIVIPPAPIKNDPATTPPSEPNGKTPCLDLRIRRKKRYSRKLKIYPPLKTTRCVKKVLRATLRRTKKRSVPYECVRIDPIDEEGFEDLHLEDVSIPQVAPKTNNIDISNTSSLHHLINQTRDPLGFSFVKPRSRPKARVICDPFESLSADGWSVLVDPTGEFLTPSMVRIWCIRNRLKENEHIRSLGDDLWGHNRSIVASSLTTPATQSCPVKRRKQTRKHELTAKPGHTSLLINHASRDLSIVPWYGEIERYYPCEPDVQLSGRLKFLLRTYKEIFLTIQFYLAQLLDSLVSSDDTENLSCTKRKTSSDDQQFDKFSAQKARALLSYQKRKRKMNARKILVRWNASLMKRKDKAACIRNRGMGRGRLNCSVKRAF